APWGRCVDPWVVGRAPWGHCVALRGHSAHGAGYNLRSMSPRSVVHERLRVAPKDLAAFCRRWHIAKLEVFGSLLREDFGAESDVDFLVSFEPGKGPADMDWFQIKEELAQL